MTATAATRWLLPLDEAVDEQEVGGKAANLARLMREGHRVPDGVVLTDAAFQAFLAESGLIEPIESLCGRLDSRSTLEVQSAAETIAALIRDARLPQELCLILDDACQALGTPLVVRSSAVGEDGASASFAGQLDSILHVAGAAALRTALLQVWASRWSARVLAYQLGRGVSLAGMGVVIQRQIDAAVSGVLFTRTSADESRLLLEYCGGLGDALVSGRENPGRVAISREGCRWAVEAAPERPAPAEHLLLNDAQIARLARTALSIEASFGAPQDIEWTVDGDGCLWILQSRPITAPGGCAHAVAPEDLVHWSNANVNENFPEPISPLLYSIASAGYYHYFRNLGRAFGISPARLRRMEEPLRQIIGVHGARMYYNLSSIHGVLRSAPFGEVLTSSFNLFVGSEKTDTQAVSPHASRWRTLTQAAELLVVAARTAWQYLFLTRRVERFEGRAAAFAARTHPEALAGKSAGGLLQDFRTFLDIRNNRWNDAALADAASMVCYGLLQRLLARAMPAADQAALHNNLLRALPDLVSSKPALALWELSRMVKQDERVRVAFESGGPEEVLAAIRNEPRLASFARAFSAFLEEWGFRCSGELMLTTASFQERPEQVIELIRAYVALDAESPAAQLERQARERVEATARVAATLRRQRLAAGLPLLTKWHAVSIVLRCTQKAILLRERARLKQALLYSRLRRVALEIGTRLVDAGRLETREDVFFLTAEEIDALLGGSAMFPDHVRQLVALRRAAHRELSAGTPPDSLVLPRGAYFAGTAATAAGTPSPATDSGIVLNGLGACGGSVTARAAVLDGVAEAAKLRGGDVLVTRQTDPGWGPVFPLVSALVIERGGMLSHGAIIAREFGIPSVVGVRGATQAIAHGARIHVDGDLGIVRLVET